MNIYRRARLIQPLFNIVSSIAVVITLAILIFEINANTEAQKLLAAQQVLGLSAQSNMAIASDPESVSLFVALGDSGELTIFQQTRYRLLLNSIFAAYWQVHHQYQNGFLDEEIFQAYEQRNRELRSNPYSLSWWNDEKLKYSKSFQLYIDDLLENDT